MIKILKFLKEFWIQIVAIVGIIGAASIFPFKLEAMDQRQERLEDAVTKTTEQTTALYKWVEAQEQEKTYEKERVASAPPGYRWDANRREYVQ